MNYQPETNRLLYAQLLADCLRSRAPSPRGLSFVSKVVRKRRHWYLQVTVGASKAQHYLGPDTDELRELIAQEKALWQRDQADRALREKLVAMLTAGGAASLNATEARVLELLERAGVFLVGGTLVGSHAFGVYANMLGVIWDSEAMRTLDVDIGADANVEIAVSGERTDLRKALLESEMGFFEVPALERGHPSTSFSIRGRQLTVDLLTPMRGRTTTAPRPVPALGAAAQPVRFLEYLLAATEPAAVVAGAAILVNVPTPARYALHKLVTSQRRPAATQTKVLKDLAQARQLLEVLAEDRPGDLRLAWEAAHELPARFQTQLRQGLDRLPAPERSAVLRAVR